MFKGTDIIRVRRVVGCEKLAEIRHQVWRRGEPDSALFVFKPTSSPAFVVGFLECLFKCLTLMQPSTLNVIMSSLTEALKTYYTHPDNKLFKIGRAHV